jgi:hypothetical protein
MPYDISLFYSAPFDSIENENYPLLGYEPSDIGDVDEFIFWHDSHER